MRRIDSFLTALPRIFCSAESSFNARFNDSGAIKYQPRKKKRKKGTAMRMFMVTSFLVQIDYWWGQSSSMGRILARSENWPHQSADS